jgi:MoaA/NifB/PqqE/SkfB family radical SAM enzyme
MTKTCHYYVTLRCNATCEFCQCWQTPENEKIEEAGLETVLPMLKEARIKGCQILNITGGEPLLRDDLPAVLEAAKKLGFATELTTNGLLYKEKGRLLGGLVDRLFVSLDYPVAEEHDRSRGVECYQDILSAIRYAVEIGEKPIINYTMTRDSVRYLPEMVDLAGKLKVRLQLNPAYDYFGTQGFEKTTLAHIRYYGKRPNVLVNLAALAFSEAGGNRVMLPRCRAEQTTITILPDGSRVKPCFFNPGGRQGREDVCSSCMRWPYMLPSFSQGFDKYRLLDFYSEMLKRRKLS